MKGQNLGRRRVTLHQIELILSMTLQGCYRPTIAKEATCSVDTVYRYQKKYLDS